MSENIMYKNIADKMKKESLETIRDSYDETIPKQEFERSLKYIEDYITNLQQRVEYLERSNNRREDTILGLRQEVAEQEDYKSRCEKAVEYINCNKQKTIGAYGDNEDDDFEICLWEEDIDNLENILNGRSDE